MSPTPTTNDYLKSMIGWDISYNPDNMVHTMLSTATGGTLHITDEMLATNKTFADMQKQIAQLKAEVYERESRTATQAKIEKKAYEARMNAQAMYPQMAYYGDKVYASDYIKPGQVVVLDERQFSREAASQFAKNNPQTQVMVAPDPQNAIRVYPGTHPALQGIKGQTGADVRRAAANAPVAPKKPLSAARPDTKRWKYASL